MTKVLNILSEAQNKGLDFASSISHPATSVEEYAWSAQWPDIIGGLDEDERALVTRNGLDTVLYDEKLKNGEHRVRGFVRAIMTLPIEGQSHLRSVEESGLPSPKGTYALYVEVDRESYIALQSAFKNKTSARVWGTLANRLPFLEEAFGSRLEIEESGGNNRVKVIRVEHPVLIFGPERKPACGNNIQGFD